MLALLLQPVPWRHPLRESSFGAPRPAPSAVVLEEVVQLHVREVDPRREDRVAQRRGERAAVGDPRRDEARRGDEAALHESHVRLEGVIEDENDRRH